MRLLYVHERFGALAGAEANAHITATELGKRGHHMAILHGPSTGKNEAGWNATFLDRFPINPDAGADSARKAIAAFNPDVVYVHKMADLDVIQALVDSGKPLVRMVVVTTYMRDELLKNGFDPARIRIHAPVPRMGDPNLRSTFSDRNLILYAGQIIRGKGVDVLLEALAKVKSPFECIILGDGNHKAFCEDLSRKLGLQDRVHFKGFIPQEELKAYYRECSVVAFDAGGIKDWLFDGHNGYLVPWMDRDAFARRTDELLNNKPLARKLGENGLQLVSERYDFDGYIKDHESMFAEVAGVAAAA